jgi:hypothetical protein
MGTEDLLEGYDTMPWLRAISEKVSLGVARTDWELSAVLGKGGKTVRSRTLQRATHGIQRKALEVLSRAGKLREIDDHVFFDMLEDPNPYMGREGLLKVTNTYVDLVGDAYWVKERNKLGAWVGSWPLPPHWVLYQPTPDQPWFRVVYKAWRVDLPLREVVWFHEPSPWHPYARGSGIGWALGDEVEVDEYAAKMAKALFYNQARPDVVIYGFDNVDEKKRVERDWTNKLQGFWRAHKPYFMTGEPKFHEFARPTMEQLVYPSLRKAQRDIVMQTWGAPPEMFGISESGNLSRVAYEAAEYLFEKWVVAPRSARMRSILQKEVALEYDPRLVLSYPSQIPDDKQTDLSAMKAAPWLCTIDEWRKRLNYGEASVAGDAVFIPLNGYVTEDPTDLTTRPLPTGGTDKDPLSPTPAEEEEDKPEPKPEGKSDRRRR